ncbi:unnamed protein product [Protopolystoma xenopodis]|uniref:Uncharacterized protein n=1 Tax=Protopolystoma xenopodis TaxID=117903 RepID=A0A3S5FE75_9PLAT|nr:unnamed protein product [Protopolystoma xenopodis]
MVFKEWSFLRPYSVYMGMTSKYQMATDELMPPPTANATSTTSNSGNPVSSLHLAYDHRLLASSKTTSIDSSLLPQQPQPPPTTHQLSNDSISIGVQPALAAPVSTCGSSTVLPVANPTSVIDSGSVGNASASHAPGTVCITFSIHRLLNQFNN